MWQTLFSNNSHYTSYLTCSSTVWTCYSYEQVESYYFPLECELALATHLLPLDYSRSDVCTFQGYVRKSLQLPLWCPGLSEHLLSGCFYVGGAMLLEVQAIWKGHVQALQLTHPPGPSPTSFQPRSRYLWVKFYMFKEESKMVFSDQNDACGRDSNVHQIFHVFSQMS